MSDFPKRLHDLRKSLGLTQAAMADRMGLSMSYVHQLEGGKRTPSHSVETLVRILEQQAEIAPVAPDSAHGEAEPRGQTLPALELPPVKFVPVIGWAHAGESPGYEELPKSWADQVPTECRDPKAFAVRLEGDSMEPTFRDGDLLIVMPSKEPYSGCFVVCRFKDDGVVFRRLETAGSVIRLVPLNDRYPVSEHSAEEFSWIYPVWGRWSQLWKR